MSDIERAVLATVLFQQDAIIEIRERVTPDVFTTPDHRAIYEAMLACADAHRAPDFITLSAELDRAGHESASMLLPDLMGEPVTVAWLPSYLDTLLRDARVRAVVASATRVIQDARTDPDVDVHALLQRIVTETPNYGVRSGPRPLADLVPELRERLDQQLAGTWQPKVTSTGYPTLDTALDGGFRPGELIILAARPGMGKTAMALGLALHASRHGAPLFFSLEMSMLSIVERAMADLSDMPLSDVRGKRLTAQQHKVLTSVLDRMERVPLHIDATSGLTTEQALARTQRFIAAHPCPLVVADYLEIMGDRNDKSEERRVGEISKRMKHLALTCNVPVVLLCQLSRQVEAQKPPIPQLDHLRYSGSIEADADVVLMLYRNDYYAQTGKADADESKVDTCDVLIRKFRNGATGSVSLHFDPATMTFSDPTADPWERMSA